MSERIADLSCVLNRVEALERQNRRLRTAAVLIPALLMGGLLVRSEAQPTPILKAEEFRVVDANGKTRALLAAKPDGSVGLGFSDAEGKRVASFDVTPTGISLGMGGEGAKASLVLDVQAGGNATVTLADAKRKPRSALGLAATGDAFVSLYDTQGTLRQALLVQSSAPDSPATINVFDATGKQIWLAPKPPAAPKK